ncbi:tetratricopeptide repeat protein [Lusitaniella coriacea LEGE 07157]|uniref:Tetratricopeptide repeat protein n=1 Tax=Lusitaniella coriacea LEGE 07157 TaxID=945747 RepID=A0A8J7B6M4_9CYAN|nr:tetratricopeptide repeat protein [Lusitaniella coriacea]MBE9114559.1 tetratricopeptide repeat protein [Lusitaniella coriacea LEGE 07157]
MMKFPRSHSSPTNSSENPWSAMLTEGSGAEGSNLAQHLRALVLEKSNQGDYPTAIALLTQLLEREPDNAVDYNNRGLMYFQNAQYPEALADYNKAIELNSRLDSAYNNRANCHAAQGNLAQAIADYQVALDFNPGNLRAWINQGVTYRELGLYDLALENFDLALVLGKRLQGRIYGERGRTYHLRGDWNCAVADYQRAMENLPATLSARRYLRQVETWFNQLLNPLSA